MYCFSNIHLQKQTRVFDESVFLQLHIAVDKLEHFTCIVFSNLYVYKNKQKSSMDLFVFNCIHISSKGLYAKIVTTPISLVQHKIPNATWIGVVLDIPYSNCMT